MNCILVPLRRNRRRTFHAFAHLLLAIATAAAFVAPAGAAPAPQAEKPLFTPGQLLVQFRTGTTTADRARAARDESTQPLGDVTSDGLVKVQVGPNDSVERAAARFLKRPDVEYAVPNLKAATFFVPNDSLITSTTMDLAWSLRSVHAYDAWDIQTGDPSVVVGIM